MPNLNDFYAFKMSGGDSENENSGCLRPVLILVIVVGILNWFSRCGR